MSPHSLHKALVIAGPTASGKTALAIQLAKRCDGEIVSADSRQIYRFLDIGTAKPSFGERKQARHHLIDFLNPDVVFSAGEYAQKARPVVQDILSRRKTPIIVGGSGLYVRALIDGLFEGKYKDEAIRNTLRIRSEREGVVTLHEELKQADHDAAERIHPNDAKRIIRALEVFKVTGKTLSAIQKAETLTPDFPCSLWGLEWPRAKLYERIEARVDAMIQSGFVDEVRRLEELGYSPGLNSLDTLGYREVFQHLSGAMTREEMTALIKQNTRRFAKRQLTWFRADPRIRWIALDGQVDWGKIASDILNAEREEILRR